MISLHNRTFQTNDNPFILLTLSLWQHPTRLPMWCCPVVNPGSTTDFPSMTPSPLWWRLHSFCHVRLGVNFMSWSNFCVLVYFLCLGGILLPWVILFGYVVTWWMTSSLYGGHVNDFFSVLVEIFVLVWFCMSWCHFAPWCDHWIFEWFFFALAKFFIFVWFCLIWCCIISWYDQRHLGMIFLLFVDYFVLVWFCLIWSHFVSWCE